MSQTARAPKSSRASRLALALGSVLATCLVLELALRVRTALRNDEVLARALARIDEPSDDPDAGLGNIIRLSANDRLVYELQADLVERSYHGALVSTDARGFRLTGPPGPPRDGAFTIVGLGDSIQFGDGVEDDQTYLAELSRLLAEAHPERAWRVVNTAVPGYNTVMEVETLRAKALDLAPDLVILNLVSNDYAPPKYVRNEVDPWTPRRSFLLDLVRKGLRAFGGRPVPAYLAEDGVMRAGKEWWEEDQDGARAVPERFSHLFGRPAFEAALAELAALAAEHGFAVLVFSTYDHPKIQEMFAAARAHDFPCVTLMDELVAWLREHRGQEFSEETYSSSPLVVAEDNAHPSALQHGMAARRLLRELETRGLLDPAPTRAGTEPSER